MTGVMVPSQINVQGQFVLLNQFLHNTSARRKAHLAVHHGLLLSTGPVHRRTSIVQNISAVSHILKSESYSPDGPYLQVSIDSAKEHEEAQSVSSVVNANPIRLYV